MQFQSTPFLQSATRIRTSLPGYLLLISFSTSSSLLTVLALMITLKPSLARLRARALPIPSDDPVTKAQVLRPYLSTRFFLFLNSLYSLDSRVNSFLAIIRAPMTQRMRVVLGHSSRIESTKFIASRLYNNYRETLAVQMNPQRQAGQPMAEQKIVEMIEEFIGCLNYPATKAALAKEKLLRGPTHPHPIEAALQDGHEQQGSGMGDECKIEEQSEKRDARKEAVEKVADEKQEFAWKLSQAKYYSKFATFSEIVSFLETSASHRQIAEATLRQKQLMNTNNQILEESINSKPTLLHLFSAYDTISRVKEFTLPVHRNLSLEPKFSKPPKLLESSSKENFLCLVDENSALLLINLQDRQLVQVLKANDSEPITAIRWLKSGTLLATGTSTGKLVVYAISQSKSLEKLTTLNPHLSEITCMFCSKDYLYTCGADYTICRIYIRFWKIEWSTKLRGTGLRKMIKVEHKKLKDAVIGITSDGSELVMVDEVTGFMSTLFSIRRDHAAECRKVYERKEEKVSKSTIVKHSFISDIVANNDNDSLIISVAGINPSIYEVDPLSNECYLRLNYKSLKCPLLPASVAHEEQHKQRQREAPNIHMALTHRAEILAITTNSNVILFVRVKNWRIVHEQVEDKSMALGELTSTRRHAETDELFLFTSSLGMEPVGKRKVEQEKECILSVHNLTNGNIENYYSFKSETKTIRSDNVRSRPFMPAGMGFPTSAQGFLELLQTIRENYQAFV